MPRSECAARQETSGVGVFGGFGVGIEGGFCLSRCSQERNRDGEWAEEEQRQQEVATAVSVLGLAS
jgi:hypothetical protein